MSDGRRAGPTSPAGRLPYEVAGDGTGRRPRPRGDRRHAPVGSAVGGARRRATGSSATTSAGSAAPTSSTPGSRTAPTSSPCMDAAGLDRAVLVGCSRAGSIVIDTALEFPDRVSRPRLGLRRHQRARGRGDAGRGGRVRAGGGPRGGEGLGSRRRPRRRDLGRRLRAAGGARACCGARRDPHDGLRDLRPGEAVRRHDRARPAGHRAARRAARAGARDRRAGSTSPRRGSAPTRIVAAVPGARRIDLPDVAHMPSLERPEWFTATLLEFLARSTSRARAPRSPQPDHALDAIRMSGRSSRACVAYCGYFARSATTAAA